ncbi:hypothetical protein PLESTM_001047800 [Pleodorina starrii]|nr:hypothetical protein PLESTM_001047800 [Pleodorina starrii]
MACGPLPECAEWPLAAACSLPGYSCTPPHLDQYNTTQGRGSGSTFSSLHTPSADVHPPPPGVTPSSAATATDPQPSLHLAPTTSVHPYIFAMETTTKDYQQQQQRHQNPVSGQPRQSPKHVWRRPLRGPICTASSAAVAAVAAAVVVVAAATGPCFLSPGHVLSGCMRGSPRGEGGPIRLQGRPPLEASRP